MPLSCDRCKQPDVFRNLYDVHLDVETMEFVCNGCFVGRVGLCATGLSQREQGIVKARLMAEQIIIDPVCKAPIFDRNPDLQWVNGQQSYYFCSERCKRRFEASPYFYVRRYQRHGNPQLGRKGGTPDA